MKHLELVSRVHGKPAVASSILVKQQEVGVLNDFLKSISAFMAILSSVKEELG